MKQAELAKELNLTQANISRIEASTRGPSSELLIAIAEVLRCDVRELLGVAKDKDETAKDLDLEAKAFVLRAIENDPQIGMHLRRFVRSSDDMTDEDWKFVATSLKLALGHAADTIEAKHIKGNF